MSEEQKDEKARSTQGAPELLVQGVADVISAMFGVGASLARTFAEATAPKDEGVTPPPSDRPLDGLVHYSIASASNVIKLVISGVGSAAGAVRPDANGTQDAAPASPSAPAGSMPHVNRGGTLRIPLSIENPGNEVMSGMRAVCTSLTSDSSAPGRPLPMSAVRFQPESLTIAPRDFEKLTVFVDTEPDTAAGFYEAVIQIGAEGFGTHIRFEVRSAESTA